MKELKVSSNTNPGKLAGAIAAEIKESDRVKLISIGAASVNQAVKATVLAQNYLMCDGIKIALLPAFEQPEDNGIYTKAVSMLVFKREKVA